MMSQSPNCAVFFSFSCVTSPPYFPCDCDCVPSCLRTFRVSPLMCCCSSVLLIHFTLTHLINLKKGLQLFVVLDKRQMLACSRTYELFLVFLYSGCHRSTFLFHCAVGGPIILHMWPTALQILNLGPFPVCYNTSSHHYCDLDDT